MLYSKHAILIILLYLTGTVTPCMPANTSELRIPFGRSVQEEKEHIRRAPEKKTEPSTIKITIKDQEQIRAKTFTQVQKNHTEENSSEFQLEKEELVITRNTVVKNSGGAPVNNLAQHRAAFQRAKAFRSKETSSTSTTTTTTSKPARTTTEPTTSTTSEITTTTYENSSDEELATRPARAQASKTVIAEKVQKKNQKNLDKFFNIESDMCNNCPELFFPTDGGLQKVCKNWQALEKNFNLAMDPKKPKVENLETITTCSRKVTCSTPHAILKWPNFSICDILSEAASDLSFTFKCNGSHWSMNDFPIEAVSCVIKTD
ncbi:unnamed protein product [Auanema sp. JU1783]|nr:unnamed protein product [Auanema sp. JU1783]